MRFVWPNPKPSFTLARELEAKHTSLVQAVTNRPAWSNPGRNQPPGLRPAVSPPLLSSPPKASAAAAPIAATPIRRLTREEKIERDAKGLCYNCDQTWSKTHRCGRFLLMMGDEDDDGVTEENIEEDVAISAHISSLNSLAGVTTPRSLRLT